MIILAFDLGTSTGVAVGSVQGGPVCQTERLGDPGDPHGARFLQTARMTQRLIREHRPTVIAIEEPIASGVVGSSDRPKMAMGLRAQVFAMAHLERVRTVEYAASTIRKHFLGQGNLRRNAAKVATVKRCGHLGWKVVNDDEADACAVWDLARCRLAHLATPVSGGLFDHVKPDT